MRLIDTHTHLDFPDFDADRARLLGDAQRLLAEDSVHAFLYSNQWITVANKNLKGLWKDMPVFVNDISALSWS